MSRAACEGISAEKVPAAGIEIQELIYASISTPSIPGSSIRATKARDTVPLRFAASELDAGTTIRAQADVEQRIAKESEKSFEAGRQRGLQEGAQAERDAQGQVRNLEKEQQGQRMAGLMRKFDDERERYLHAIEREVVNLALAIAARVLRREAQMDPLLLTGAVRAALGQLADSTEVRLRVPATELDLWKEAIAYIPNLAVKPVLLPDDGLQGGECMIETQLGSVDLGIRSQLGEIERGFFDHSGRKRSDTMDPLEGFAPGTRS